MSANIMKQTSPEQQQQITIRNFFQMGRFRAYNSSNWKCLRNKLLGSGRTKTKPVAHNAPSRPAPWSWLNKGKQQEADLKPIKSSGNPGERDNKIPMETPLQDNAEIVKSALDFPNGGSNLEFSSDKSILLLQEILQPNLNTSAWILLSLSCSHSSDSSNSWALLCTSGRARTPIPHLDSV